MIRTTFGGILLHETNKDQNQVSKFISLRK